MSEQQSAREYRPRPHMRIPIDVEPLVRGYNAGKGIRALVSDTGHSYGTIRKRLLDAGVQMRSKGAGRAKPPGQET